MQQIIVEIGDTRLETLNAQLARQVLEQSTGLATLPQLFAGELLTSFTPPDIGTYWHGQGGVYVGMMRGEHGTADWPLIVPTDPAGQVEEITWGSDGENEPDARCNRDGLENTRALVNSAHDHPAAQWASELEIDGLRDYYLPARHELRLIYLNAPELVSSDDYYLSSTQCSPNSAWVQDFDVGDQNLAHKVSTRRAVAVRRAVNPLAI